MAHIDSGGDKDINVDVNLVPFIDLMSVCIIFLLITSVWTQISMIQLGSSIYAQQLPNQEKPPEQEKVSINVRVTTNGYNVTVNGAGYTIPKMQGGQYDKKSLLTRLQQVKQRFPEHTSAIVFVDDVVAYEELIRGMDVLMLSGFTNLSVGG